jgi:hypothetical protein
MLVCDAPSLSHRAIGGYQLHTRIPGPHRVVDWLDRADGGVLHFQHAEWRRLLAKQLLYQMTEVLRYCRIHANYAGTCDETGLATAPVQSAWVDADAMAYIRRGAEPWQQAEVNRLLAKYGRERFAACSLLGSWR